MIWLIFSIVLFSRLPSILLIPNSILYTHNIIRLFILLVILGILLHNNRQIITKSSFGSVTIGVLVFFISQSISVVNAINIYAYLSNYKDLVFSVLFFYGIISILPQKEYKLFILKSLVIATSINVIYQLFVILLHTIVNPIIHNILHPSYLKFFDYQFNRGRYFGESFDEVTIPIILWLMLNEKLKSIKVYYLMLICAVVFISLVSNWRTKTIIMLISLALGIITNITQIKLFLKNRRYLFLVIPILMITIVTYAIFTGNSLSKEIFIQRYDLNNQENILTITGRFNYWSDAIKIGFQHILIGSGIGNYYDNLIQVEKLSKQSNPAFRGSNFIFIDDPHNILLSLFVYSGLFGLISFVVTIILLISHFIKFKTSTLKRSLLWSFLALLLFAFFNPYYYFYYLIFLFILLALTITV